MLDVSDVHADVSAIYREVAQPLGRGVAKVTSDVAKVPQAIGQVGVGLGLGLEMIIRVEMAVGVGIGNG